MSGSVVCSITLFEYLAQNVQSVFMIMCTQNPLALDYMSYPSHLLTAVIMKCISHSLDQIQILTDKCSTAIS